jgi:hypothetical protein
MSADSTKFESARWKTAYPSNVDEWFAHPFFPVHNRDVPDGGSNVNLACRKAAFQALAEIDPRVDVECAISVRSYRKLVMGDDLRKPRPIFRGGAGSRRQQGMIDAQAGRPAHFHDWDYLRGYQIGEYVESKTDVLPEPSPRPRPVTSQLPPPGSGERRLCGLIDARAGKPALSRDPSYLKGFELGLRGAGMASALTTSASHPGTDS